MDWMEMLKQIFQVCIIPLLGILTVYIVKFINAKSEELKATANNELYQKYITLLTDTITSCVIATNQTYVDALKDKPMKYFSKPLKGWALSEEDEKVIDELVKQKLKQSLQKIKALLIMVVINYHRKCFYYAQALTRPNQ